jgi:hypothetical protein
MDVDKARIEIETLEKKYRDEGLEPVRFPMPIKAGCRSCGDGKKGPWTVSIMSSKLPEVGKAIIFIVTLCEKCLSSRERCDDVAEGAACAYLADSCYPPK